MEDVLFGVEDGIATITLNRPAVLNAFTLSMLERIHEYAARAEEDPSVAVVVVKANGRAFCAGADMKELGRHRATTVEEWLASRLSAPGHRLFWVLNKATIAQVQGHAVAGGMVIAAMCDITIAAPEAKFGYPEVRYGGFHAPGHVFNWLVGPKKAKELLLTGRLMDANEACLSGLINGVVPADQLDAAVRRVAEDIVALERKNPGFVRANKAAINSVTRDLTASALPYWEANRHAMNAFLVASVQSQTQFFRTIADQGLDAGMRGRDGAFGEHRDRPLR